MKLAEVFRKGKQFIPYITCGFPDRKKCVDIIKIFLEEGVEIIEIGIPFSDPVADGPTIQYSSQVALNNKVGIEEVFDTILATLKYKPYLPVIMTYLNPVIVYGIEKFLREAEKIGVKGVIFADAIIEEKDVFYPLTKKYGIDTIFLLSPTTQKERREQIYKYSQGFVYIITLAGTTGARYKLPANFYNFVKQVRKETAKPLCAGFGISRIKQILPVIEHIDGFIVGSAIIEKIRKDKSLKELKNFVKKFVDFVKSY
ncbi:MAG: tryptophan synthase subunit alpha [Elusimicrobiota bacterium]|nr:tryptophan synthase subunit alpha [Elusimicrobiota bacterium]